MKITRSDFILVELPNVGQLCLLYCGKKEKEQKAFLTLEKLIIKNTTKRLVGEDKND